MMHKVTLSEPIQLTTRNRLSHLLERLQFTGQNVGPSNSSANRRGERVAQQSETDGQPRVASNARNVWRRTEIGTSRSVVAPTVGIPTECCTSEASDDMLAAYADI